MIFNLHVLDQSGDIKITWDADDAESCRKARVEVEHLKAAGYHFFLVDGNPADEVTAGRGTLNCRRISADELLPPVTASTPRPEHTEKPAPPPITKPEAVTGPILVKPPKRDTDSGLNRLRKALIEEKFDLCQDYTDADLERWGTACGLKVISIRGAISSFRGEQRIDKRKGEDVHAIGVRPSVGG